MKRIGLPLAATLLTAGLTLTACGSYSEDDLKDDLSDEGGLTDEQAECTAKEVFDSDLNDDEIEALGSDADDITDTDLSADEQAEVTKVLSEAVIKCTTE